MKISGLARRGWLIGYSFSVLLVAFSVAWLILAPLNFLYPLWHNYAGIAEGIERYAPQNHYKHGFAQTTPKQRFMLFEQINLSVHQGGQGLANIHYHTPTSDGPQTLLREPEIIHLQDVAKLISTLMWFAVVNLVVFLSLSWITIKRQKQALSVVQALKGNALFIGIVLALLLLIGPTKVFNQLHIWVFPSEHQWFFYYQDSLMSTMMLAPQLFAWIGGALLVLTALILPLLLFVVGWLGKMRLKP